MPTEFPFDQARFEETQLLFPDDIEDDPWVLFHGTSSSFAPRIEAEGLRRGQETVGRTTIEHIVNIFERLSMNPDDVGFGAYNVLKQYAGFDYGVTKGEPGLSPLYLAASSGKAATYASDDFLGGEKLRGVRKSLEVLDRVLHDEEGTSTYREYFGVPSYTFGEPDFATADEALNWLRVEWDRLAAVREAVAQQRRADLCGVVYALQVPPADVSGFSIHRFMGIIVERDIPLEWLIGVVRIPRDQDVGRGWEDSRQIWWPREDGVLLAIGGGGSPRYRGLRNLTHISMDDGVLTLETNDDMSLFFPDDLLEYVVGLTFSVCICGEPTGTTLTVGKDGRLPFYRFFSNDGGLPRADAYRAGIKLAAREVDIEPLSVGLSE